jgi:hypothetical protein
MFNYVREHNIITEHQSGFQPIDSTVNQLLHIYHTIISNLGVINREVSSAKSYILQASPDVISFMYKRNKNGPNTETW